MITEEQLADWEAAFEKDKPMWPETCGVVLDLVAEARRLRAEIARVHEEDPDLAQRLWP